MAVTTKNIIPRKVAELATTTQYTATSVRCIIDKLTATNTSAGNVTIDVHLCPSGGTASASNKVTSTKTIVPNEAYTFPEIVGQVLEAGGFIATACSSGTALVISAAGREIS